MFEWKLTKKFRKLKTNGNEAKHKIHNVKVEKSGQSTSSIPVFKLTLKSYMWKKVNFKACGNQNRISWFRESWLWSGHYCWNCFLCCLLYFRTKMVRNLCLFLLLFCFVFYFYCHDWIQKPNVPSVSLWLSNKTIFFHELWWPYEYLSFI